MNKTDSLKQRTHEQLQSTIDDIELINGLIRKYEAIDMKLKEDGISLNYLSTLVNVLRYRLFIGFLFGDICSTLNIYNNAKTLYEEKFAVRTFFIIISEGFKKIYNFIKINEKGDVISKYRNKSFWIKEIKPLIYNDLPYLKDNYNQITKKLDSFLQFDFQVIKINRDLAVHYDDNPLLVYDMMIKLDLEKEIDLILKFMDIINGMFTFTEVIVSKFLEKIDSSSKELENNAVEKIEELIKLLSEVK
ncbi:hypothetical protein SAMN05421786_106151 [Chryseobacterium ureilyticum]|uniref:Uncharacterized protein n=1 Tax=Chryseobacterium ureilyticum TaxID=373668 RepID=A0A1N7PT21_9FLAO|nr:hypothetical protein [Chryseobacterium ureilyticum]SIT13589.1 hypothetical protein SAMN05421786_106151 [Chryseobacterium ureilyticum]